MEGLGDVRESVFGNGEDDRNHRETHHETNHQRVPLLEADAGHLRPPQSEISPSGPCLGQCNEKKLLKSRSKIPCRIQDPEQNRRKTRHSYPG